MQPYAQPDQQMAPPPMAYAPPVAYAPTPCCAAMYAPSPVVGYGYGYGYGGYAVGVRPGGYAYGYRGYVRGPVVSPYGYRGYAPGVRGYGYGYAGRPGVGTMRAGVGGRSMTAMRGGGGYGRR